ncbi:MULTISPECIES: hypothetical protein [unclassified Breznakia]|uniref:hypothetical protein n=1 Tax=unclassified Breznakia TaxID=2623764 RepID=UPI00247718E1|nr:MULTISPECIES: hypothetical protein [unclassified Breznakia]MDH6366296.1 hypothetical protein [Breznakia sp. PH1-1]MDH6403389.1 hypothetical protein [Breznakia sp. PF1-11]MDH6411098.1 hypothetical protein [Breznakia sp. PFB1-11]MDH6413462.1 hypothetical protein [Breznakia sp. PFB1-14]MDH6416749.1 hypothetical protein [Breznakia sp. PFB1-4]
MTKNHKIVTCTGYYGTGSSAVTNILQEFNNIKCAGDYEVRFVMDPKGVSDLEYFLIENPNRHNSSHALKEFIRYTDFLNGIGSFNKYKKYFNNQFDSLTKRYINDLTEIKYGGFWHYDVYDKGKIYLFFNRLYNKFKKIYTKILFKKSYPKLSFFGIEANAYCPTTDEKVFLDSTVKYTNSLLEAAGLDENYEYICIDQIVPPSNIKRYSRYFEDIKVVIVERDPRDIFIHDTKIWTQSLVPKNVEKFCEWYKWTRAIPINDANNNVLKIQFEDLIYNYEESIYSIGNFLNIDLDKHHVDKMKVFKPDVSIKNTEVWMKFPEEIEHIKYIERELEAYCYDFNRAKSLASKRMVNDNDSNY